MRIHMSLRLDVRTCALFLLAGLAGIPARGMAQGQLDRDPLDFPERRVPPAAEIKARTPATGERTSLTGEGPKIVATWAVHPTFSARNDSRKVGISLDFRNKSLLGEGRAIRGAIAARLVNVGATQRPQYLASGRFDPNLRKPLGDSTTVSLSGSLSFTDKVATDVREALEVDYNLSMPKDFAVGVVGYLDDHLPDGGGSTSGATPGVTLRWAFDNRTNVVAEYDGNSKFAGQDNFSCRLSRTIVANPLTSVAFGAEKHGRVSVELKIGYDQVNAGAN